MFSPTEVLRVVKAKGQQASSSISVPLAGVTLRGNKRGPDIRAGFAHITSDGTRSTLRIHLFPTTGVVEFTFPDEVPAPKPGTYSVRVPLEKGEKEAFWTTIGYAVVEDRKAVVALEAIPPTGLAVVSFSETLEERRARREAEKAERAEGVAEAAEEAVDPGWPEDPFQD